MDQRVLAGLTRDFQVGSDDWNDVLFTRQRVHWMKDPYLGSSMEVRQERAMKELEEISVEKNTKLDPHCIPAMHTRCRSLLGQKLVAK